MSFAEQLKKARKERKMTIEKFAEYLDVSYSSIFNWEHGKLAPNEEMRKRIEKILGIQEEKN